MPIFLLPLAVLAMGWILYFIVSGKSAPAVRRAAIAAFFLALLSILVCSIFVLGRPAAAAGSVYSPDSGDFAAPAPPQDLVLTVVIILLFIFFAVFIAVAARREQKRRKNG
ncbi:MAG: hypothetical protein LBL20_00125 [Treponema sp.]|jgi:formate-dependent nitrite reductase membrane component NrfD|nr:hypothetical protein [Treponema sp.]